MEKFKSFFEALDYFKNDNEKASEIFRYIRNQKQFLNRTTCPCCRELPTPKEMGFNR